MTRWFYVGLAALAAGEIALPHVLDAVLGVDRARAHFWFEDIPAWGSLFGMVACLATIIVSKLLGKLLLTRPEHYYDS